VEAPARGKSKTIDRIRESGKLRAGTQVALPWLGQNPKTGQFFGPSIELAERIAQILGVELKLVTAGWDVMIAGLQANQYDITIAPLFATAKRREVVDFVKYSETGTCWAALRENTKVNTLEDLNQPSVTFGLFTGTGTTTAAMAKYPKAQFQNVVMPVGGANRFEDVLTRRVDVAHLDSPRAALVVHQYPQFKIIPGGPDHCMKNPDIPFDIAMALSYGDPEFKKFLEAVVEDFKAQFRASLDKHSSLEFMLQR
jgi:polar amino acid transport system substrate-binding protein